jgi:hypothetical protein
MLYNTIGGKLPLGKPKRRWIEAVEENAKTILSIQYWEREAVVRRVWRGYIQEARARYRALAP